MVQKEEGGSSEVVGGDFWNGIGIGANPIIESWGGLAWKGPQRPSGLCHPIPWQRTCPKLSPHPHGQGECLP